MKATFWLTSLLIAALTGPAYADVLEMPTEAMPAEEMPATDTATDSATEAETFTVTLPGRGMTTDQVEERFGSPSEKIAPVGEPPISRWVYNGFIVYFEYDHVIHAVNTQ